MASWTEERIGFSSFSASLKFGAVSVIRYLGAPMYVTDISFLFAVASINACLIISIPFDLVQVSSKIPRISTWGRSEEHTSELQSRRDLVCRLLLEKKKKNKQYLSYPLTYI